MQSPKSPPPPKKKKKKKWMNPQSTAIEGSPDPLKARSESEIRVKILERARLKGATKGPGGGGGGLP